MLGSIFKNCKRPLKIKQKNTTTDQQFKGFVRKSILYSINGPEQKTL